VPQSIICARAFEFAVRVLTLCEKLWPRGAVARHIASQLMSCGTSIGSNAEEAQDAQTKPDYIARMAISRKVVTSNEIAWEVKEAGELRAMIVSAIRTAQSSSSRGS
jgi:23S rRNA-intervening sequence protein